MFFFVIFRASCLRDDEPRHDFLKRGFGPGLDLLPGLVLNRVRDVDRIKVRPA
jgi:hypothetical protein